MAKKRKKPQRPQTPPLSRVDTVIWTHKKLPCCKNCSSRKYVKACDTGSQTYSRHSMWQVGKPVRKCSRIRKQRVNLRVGSLLFYELAGNT